VGAIPFGEGQVVTDCAVDATNPPGRVYLGNSGVLQVETLAEEGR
jgi:hypothetical protein